ncbi:penicillin acylase family protein [Sphingomonas sp. MMS24-J13]|uniref:penicillin acylase family protein n=1 Tax=Sphingomonas sp. MMS24-J13 TaxID=3238686 RepID=UPI00384C91C2
MKSKALRRIGIGVAGLLGLILFIVAILLIMFFLRLERSKPRLDGEVQAAGLAAPVQIDRDAAGVPTLTGHSRTDLAYATGYLHAQERYFQMDMMRRAAAGELGSLFGAAGLKIDEKTRIHLFRVRARNVFAHMTPAEQAILRTYVAGVNKGLGDLKAPPFEYMLLRQTPQPWRPEDSLLIVYAMYLDLQEAEPRVPLDRARAVARVGPAMADLLYPLGTELDAPLDGSPMPPVALPAKLGAALPAPHGADLPEPIVKGSNNWVVGGSLTGTGAAMVANDMHLGLRVPNIWYRARLVIPGQLDIVGVTLPGIFPIVVGSNTHVAWGFTVAHVASHDAVIVDPVAGRKDWYATPGGPRPIAVRHERLCAAGACRDLPVRSTIWGPIVATLPDGREVADRWVAHGEHAIKLAPFLAIEQAHKVQDVIAAAHQTAMPDQNMVIGDSAGHIAWTIVGQIPRRFGMNGRDPASWADGSRGWAGFLGPSEIPTIVDPPAARLWSANARTQGGATLARLGPGNYDDGARALRIKQRLFAKNRFAERDMLSIQLDPTALRMPFWQSQMLAALDKAKGDPRLVAMIAPVKAWDGLATPNSVGYRLIRAFRIDVIRNAYVAYIGKPEDTGISSYALTSSEQAMRELLRARPAALVPPGSATWDAFLASALADVARSVADEAGGDVNRYTWGRWLTASIHHPLAQAIPLLGLLTDPKDEPVPGDNGVVRAQARGAGASERLAVSPGHEAQGLFQMPGGQSGAPLAPYYLAGHRDWVEGRAAPLLPGATRWTLTLRP